MRGPGRAADGSAAADLKAWGGREAAADSARTGGRTEYGDGAACALALFEKEDELPGQA